MRVYRDLAEARNEIERDLAELGTTVRAGYQSLDQGSEKSETKELQDYDYVVLNPLLGQLEPTRPWAEQEWAERLDGILHIRRWNPGRAWEARAEVWSPLREIENGGTFAYTYSERLWDANIESILDALRQNSSSRQAYLSIWNPMIDGVRLGKRRVPCSLGYQVMVRNDRLNLAYHMRSSDFKTHWDNDVWMALKLQDYFAHGLGLARGSFTHKIGSFHVYSRDVVGVF